MTNHGISEKVIHDTLQMAKEFFALPLETKMEVSYYQALQPNHDVHSYLARSRTKSNRTLRATLPCSAEIITRMVLATCTRALNLAGRIRPRTSPVNLSTIRGSWSVRTCGPRQYPDSEKQSWSTSMFQLPELIHVEPYIVQLRRGTAREVIIPPFCPGTEPSRELFR